MKPLSFCRDAASHSGSRLLFCIIGLLFLPGCAAAIPWMSADRSSYSELPGSQFIVSLVINNPDSAPVVAYDFQIHASALSVFRIESQILHSALNESNFTGLFPQEVITSAEDTDNFDFGVFAAAGGAGTGSLLAQELTFAISPDAPIGDYSLTLGWNQPAPGGISLVDDNLVDYQMAEPVSLSISVVPEPASLFLTGAGLLVLPWFQRRRRGI